MNDEVIDPVTSETNDSGTQDVSTETAPSTDEFGQPIPAKEPTLDELLAGYGEPDAPPVDPNATPEAALPESITEALGLNEYFREPEHLKTAVMAAGELFDVENGKIPVYQMLEGFRARNADGFSKILNEGLIPYIEHITGKKLGGEAQAVDPNDPQAVADSIRKELSDRDARDAKTRQDSEAQANNKRAYEAGTAQATALLKGTAFEGQEKRFLSEMDGACAALKMDPNQVVQQAMRGDFRNFDKAVKSIQNQKITDAKAVIKWMKDDYGRKKNILPTSKTGNNGSAVVPGGVGPNSSKADLANYLLNGSPEV